jgi:hypothetical protein
MKNLFELGNQYAKESDWKDFALLKFCLCAVGIMIGTQVTPKYKKIVVCASAGVFIAAYIPLMMKVCKIMMRDNIEINSASAEL